MTFSEEISTLERLLNRGSHDGPMYMLTCENAFEPHGRASETWEVVYKLGLMDVPAHWYHVREGWIPCTPGAAACMHFSGRTMADVVQKAVAFLAVSGVRPVLASRDPGTEP